MFHFFFTGTLTIVKLQSILGHEFESLRSSNPSKKCVIMLFYYMACAPCFLNTSCNPRLKILIPEFISRFCYCEIVSFIVLNHEYLAGHIQLAFNESRTFSGLVRVWIPYGHWSTVKSMLMVKQLFNTFIMYAIHNLSGNCLHLDAWNECFV